MYKNLKSLIVLLLIALIYLTFSFFSCMHTKILSTKNTTDTITIGTVRITDNAGESKKPSAVWTGTEYGLSWCDNSDGNYEIYFSRLNANGIKQGSDTRITNDAANDTYPVLTWNGTEYGLVFISDRDGDFEIFFARINEYGVKQGTEIKITSNTSVSFCPGLAWTGSEYGLAWYDNSNDVNSNYKIYFTRLNFNGVELQQPTRLSLGSHFFPFMIWTGSEYGICFEENATVMFTRVNSSGVQQGGNIYISNSCGNLYPSITWTGSEYGLAWYDDRSTDKNLYFARLDSSGAKTGSDKMITDTTSDSLFSRIAWNGSGYGIVWNDIRNGEWQIFFASLDADGNKISDDILIADAYNTTSDPNVIPRLLWTGSAYVTTWVDDAEGNQEVYFAVIKADGDIQ